MNLWNTRNLSMPPINTFKAANTNIDIRHLEEVFQEGKTFFDNENYMKAEYAVLWTVFYRSKQKFRSAKDFKSLEKLFKALGIYFKSNISYNLQCFMDLIPVKYTDETYLPNKNLVDYILIRLQGLVKLLERIVETCKITAYLFERRLNTGHFWKMAFIIYSLVSRLYILAKYSAKFICNFYNKVLPFSRQLKNNGRDWLPKDYTLPNDLQQWMNVDWLDVDDDLQVIEMSELPDITQFFNLVDDDDDDDDIQFCDEYIVVDDENDVERVNKSSLRSASNNKENIHNLRGFDFDEDIGEVIEVNDDSFLNIGELFTQSTEKNNISDVISISDSLSNSENIGKENSEAVIELNDNESSNNIITLNDSSVSILNENSFDLGEVIEIINSPQVTQDIINLDDSITSKSQDLNIKSRSIATETRNDFICLNNNTEKIPNSVARKKQKRKEKALKNKQKKQRKNNEKASKNQSTNKNVVNSTVTSNKRLSNKIRANGNPTFNNKNKKILGESIGKNLIAEGNSHTPKNEERQLSIKKKKLKKRSKNMEHKNKRIQISTEVSSLIVVKENNNKESRKKIEEERSRKKKSKRNKNNILPDKKSNFTHFKQNQMGHGDNHNKDSKFTFVAYNTNENVKKQKVTEALSVPGSKINRKDKRKINGKSLTKSDGNQKNNFNNLDKGVHKENKNKMKSKKKKLKSLNNALQNAQGTNSLQQIVNKIHHNAQSIEVNTKPRKKKNKQKKNKQQ